MFWRTVFWLDDSTDVIFAGRHKGCSAFDFLVSWASSWRRCGPDFGLNTHSIVSFRCDYTIPILTCPSTLGAESAFRAASGSSS